MQRLIKKANSKFKTLASKGRAGRLAEFCVVEFKFCEVKVEFSAEFSLKFKSRAELCKIKAEFCVAEFKF